MALSRKKEERLLSAEERELVAQVRQPAVKSLADADLSDVIRRLRERRDRARDIARRQRREMRGKASPAGAKPASGDRGNREKGEALNGALRRAEKERKRRQAAQAHEELVESAHAALAMKRAPQEAGPEHPASQTADEGMRPLPNESTAPSGALEQEGQRPVLERSRKVR
ncbi:MAG: hypothetical protein R3D62_04960 [Xanthobacteraceae bacterium]